MFRSLTVLRNCKSEGLKNRIDDSVNNRKQRFQTLCSLEAYDMLVLMIYSSLKVIHGDALSV